METIFECTTIYNRKNLLEFAKKTRIKLFLIFAVIIYFSCALQLIRSVYSGIAGNFNMNGSLAAATFILCIYIFNPYLIIKNTLKQYSCLYECEALSINLFLFEDHLFQKTFESKTELSIDYRKIKKIKKTKNLYLISIGSSYIIINKHGFTKGIPEDFEEFIKAKAIYSKNKNIGKESILSIRGHFSMTLCANTVSHGDYYAENSTGTA